MGWEGGGENCRLPFLFLSMRILFLYTGSLKNPQRGTPIRASNLYRYLRMEHETHLLSSEFPEQWSGEATRLSRVIPGFNWLFRVWTMRRVLRSFRPDIVYGQTHMSLFLLKVASIWGYRTCVDLHSCWEEEVVSTQPSWKVTMYRALHFYCLRSMDGATVASRAIRDRYPTPAGGWFVLHGGIDLSLLQSIDPERVAPSSVPVIAYCGNIRFYQGVEYLLGALEHLLDIPWCFLFICSSDEERARSLLRKHQLEDRTIFFSSLAQERVFALLKGADIAVVPRPDIPITHFAFPSKLPEYLASGSVVICTDVSDASSIVHDGTNGWLIRPGDEKDLIRALEDALTHPEERRKRAAQATKESPNYNWSHLVAQLGLYFHTLTI